MWPTIIAATIVFGIFAAIVINGIRNKLKGKSSCGCGSSCSTCGCGCHQK